MATALGYSNPRDALSRHVDGEDKGVAKRDTLGGGQDLTIINESGLYSLILSSKLPNAKKFKRWVTSEVLPSIRKNGRYGGEPLKDIVTFIRLLQKMMKDQGATPDQIAYTVCNVCDQYGIVLPSFVVYPERLDLKDVSDMIEFASAQEKAGIDSTYEDFIVYKTEKVNEEITRKTVRRRRRRLK